MQAGPLRIREGIIMWNTGLFLSQRFDWRTPVGVYDGLHAEFDFDFDPAPTEPDFDGLKVSWGKRNFVNPPYGRDVGLWVKKAWEESRKGKLVVMLLASRTDTAWWHDYCMEGEIRFIRGRLKFDGQTNSAPFPSAVVIFRPPSMMKDIKSTFWSFLRG